MRINHLEKRQSKISAFTIPEVVIAALLLGFAWISLSNALVNGYLIMRSARENLRSTQIMLEKVEQLRMYKWDDLIVLSQTQSTNYLDPTLKTLPVYIVTVSAPQAPGNIGNVGYQSDMRTITISTTWATTSGKTTILHTNSVQTHVAHYGMNSYVAKWL